MSKLLEFDDSKSFENSLRVEIPTEKDRNEKPVIDKKMLQSIIKSVDNASLSEPAYKQIYPSPGVCLQFTTNVKNEILFVNLCHSDEIPNRTGVPTDRLIEALGSGSCKLPISITDVCYIGTERKQKIRKTDIGLNTELFRAIMSSPIALGLTCTFIQNAVKDKLNIDCSNSVYKLWSEGNVMGTIGTHYVPIEVKNALMSEIKSEKFKKPQYDLIKGAAGPSSHDYTLKVPLEGVQLEKNIKTDISPSSVTIFTEGKIKYGLKVKLPVEVDEERCSTQFDAKKQVLTVTLPIKEKKNEDLTAVSTVGSL